MKTFREFLSESAPQGGFNVIFEAGMHSLTNDLEQIIKALRDAGVHFEVVGGGRLCLVRLSELNPRTPVITTDLVDFGFTAAAAGRRYR